MICNAIIRELKLFHIFALYALAIIIWNYSFMNQIFTFIVFLLLSSASPILFLCFPSKIMLTIIFMQSSSSNGLIRRLQRQQLLKQQVGARKEDLYDFFSPVSLTKLNSSILFRYSGKQYSDSCEQLWHLEITSYFPIVMDAKKKCPIVWRSKCKTYAESISEYICTCKEYKYYKRACKHESHATYISDMLNTPSPHLIL